MIVQNLLNKLPNKSFINHINFNKQNNINQKVLIRFIDII